MGLFHLLWSSSFHIGFYHCWNWRGCERKQLETHTDTRGTCKFSEKMEYGCSKPSWCELAVMVWVFLACHSMRDVQTCPQTMPTYVFDVHIYSCLPLSCSSLMNTSGTLLGGTAPQQGSEGVLAELASTRPAHQRILIKGSVHSVLEGSSIFCPNKTLSPPNGQQSRVWGPINGCIPSGQHSFACTRSRIAIISCGAKETIDYLMSHSKSSLFFVKNGLMTTVFRVCDKTPPKIWGHDLWKLFEKSPVFYNVLQLFCGGLGRFVTVIKEVCVFLAGEDYI